MRTPSLHITEKTLIELLEKIYDDALEAQDNKMLEPRNLAKDLLRRAKGLSCNQRVLVVKNQKERKKAGSLLISESKSAYYVAQTITRVRRQEKHRMITPIEEGSSAWYAVKKIVPLIQEFCTSAELAFDKGCTLFISWGLYLMGNTYNINKYITLAPKILEVYLADKEIDSDPYPELTLKIIKAYNNKIYTKTGILEDDLENPLKMVHFVRMVSYCKKNGYKPEDYLEAQFDGLAFANGVPDPAQIFSENSISRFVKFAYKNNIQKQKPQTKVSWDKIFKQKP